MPRVKATRTVMIGGSRYDRGQVYDVDSKEAKRLSNYFEVVEGGNDTEEVSQEEATRRNEEATQPLNTDEVDQLEDEQNPTLAEIENTTGESETADMEAPANKAMTSKRTNKK